MNLPRWYILARPSATVTRIGAEIRLGQLGSRDRETVALSDHPDQYLLSLAAKGRSLLFSQYAH